MRLLKGSGLALLLLTVFASCDSNPEDPEQNENRNDDAFKVSLSNSGSLQNPAWSPDGGSILFTRFVNGYNTEPADLFVVDLGDNSVRTLVSDGSGNISLPGSV